MEQDLKSHTLVINFGSSAFWLFWNRKEEYFWNEWEAFPRMRLRRPQQCFVHVKAGGAFLLLQKWVTWSSAYIHKSFNSSGLWRTFLQFLLPILQRMYFEINLAYRELILYVSSDPVFLIVYSLLWFGLTITIPLFRTSNSMQKR